MTQTEVWVGSVRQGPYLAPDSICSSCVLSRQAVTQSCFMGFFSGLCGPLPFSLPPSGPWGEHSVSGFLFPASGADTQRLSRAAPLLHCHSLLVLFATPGSLVGAGSGLLGQRVSFCSQPPGLSSLLDCSGEGPAFISLLAAHYTITKLLRWFRRPKVQATGDWHLHQDNVPTHASHLVQFLAKHQITQVTQPPYSPDLAPCDFWLFPKPKSPLKRKRFQAISEIQENTMGQLMAIGRTVWGPKVTPLKGTEGCRCLMYNVSCIFNKCLYFSYYMVGYLLDSIFYNFSLAIIWNGPPNMYLRFYSPIQNSINTHALQKIKMTIGFLKERKCRKDYKGEYYWRTELINPSDIQRKGAMFHG